MAYFECRTKAALIAELTPTDEPDTVFELYRKYRAVAQTALEQATRRKVIEFNELPYVLPTGKQGYLIDSRRRSLTARALSLFLTRRPRMGRGVRRFRPYSSALLTDFNRGTRLSCISQLPPSSMLRVLRLSQATFASAMHWRSNQCGSEHLTSTCPRFEKWQLVEGHAPKPSSSMRTAQPANTEHDATKKLLMMTA